jgi:hypothetical protein
MDEATKKPKRPPCCPCGSVLLADGTCRYGCHAHRKPHLRAEQEDRRLRARERAAERPIPNVQAQATAGYKAAAIPMSRYGRGRVRYNRSGAR